MDDADKVVMCLIVGLGLIALAPAIGTLIGLAIALH